MITVKQFLDAGFKFHRGDVFVSTYGNDIKVYDREHYYNEPDYADRFRKVKSLAWRKNKGEQPVADGLMVDALLFNDKEIINKDSQGPGWGLWGPTATGFHIKQWKPNLAALEQQMNDKQDMMTQAESDDIEQLEKSALEMSERDVEDVLLARPFDACTSSEDEGDDEWGGEGIPPVGVECEILDVDERSVIGVGEIYLIDGSKALILSKDIKGYPEESTIYGFDGRANLYVMWSCHNRFQKIESPQEKENREREENGRSLYELHTSLRVKDTPILWGGLSEDTASAWRKLAELVTLKDEHKE